WLKSAGNITEPEMLKTFNCGLGMVLFVAPSDADAVLATLQANGEKGHVVGRVVKNEGEQVRVRNFGQAIARNTGALFQAGVKQQQAKKRVAVLISGSGTNLKA